MMAKSATNKKVKKIEVFMYSFGVGLVVSNFIDKRFLDDRYFSWDSYYAVVIIAIVSYFNARRLNKIANKHLTK